MDYFRRIKDLEEELRVIILQRKDLLKKAVLPLLLAAALLLFFLGGGDDSVTISDESDDITVSEDGISSDIDVTDEGTLETATGLMTIYVDIGGEVNSPGVYEVSEGTRLFQVIEKAGGLTEEADIDVINRAEAVYDGQKILIASYEETEGRAKATNTDGSANNSASQTYSADDEKVNINTADSVTLQTIPGIGPSKADRIIEYRNSEGRFNKIEDIKNISGIGDKTFDSIKKYITV